jgi:acetyltransferase-like isoleucine patch superfamily enzyme
LSSDVRRSTLLGHNVVGKRSVLHASTLGEYSYVGDDCRIVSTAIGRFASIGSGVRTAFGRHPYHYLSQHPATYSLKAEAGTLAESQLFNDEHARTLDGRLVCIGHDTWIGDDVKLFDGVTVGDGAVVGTDSLVTRSVPAYAIVLGKPARIVKYRFGEREIGVLLRIQWWDWDVSAIREAVNAGLFCGPVDALESFAATLARPRAETTLRESRVDGTANH